jgi:hypothetical protein
MDFTFRQAVILRSAACAAAAATKNLARPQAQGRDRSLPVSSRETSRRLGATLNGRNAHSCHREQTHDARTHHSEWKTPTPVIARSTVVSCDEAISTFDRGPPTKPREDFLSRSTPFVRRSDLRPRQRLNHHSNNSLLVEPAKTCPLPFPYQKSYSPSLTNTAFYGILSWRILTTIPR